MNHITHIEHITIEPSIWCTSCNSIIPDTIYRSISNNSIALCSACFKAQNGNTVERKQPTDEAVRDLVVLARLSAWHLANIADGMAENLPNTAKILRDLVTATDRAVERLRRA